MASIPSVIVEGPELMAGSSLENAQTPDKQNSSSSVVEITADENEEDNKSDVDSKDKESSLVELFPVCKNDSACYETDLEFDEEKHEYHNISMANVYIETCKTLGVVPASYVCRHGHEEDLIMRHHGLGPLGAKALAIPLVTNTSITNLDISDNWIEGKGALYISEMLKENCYITDLALCDNKLGREGAVAVCDMLCQNSTLTNVNFSGNEFKDSDAPFFAQAILENNTLRHLDLSHNRFGKSSGDILGHAIGENETIEYLDLSWNHFRGKAALYIMEGVKVNAKLKTFLFAFNGLGDEGAIAVGECLKNNSVLLEMDITNNRITQDGIPAIAKGLDANENIQIFKLGNNSIGSTAALSLLNAINNERSILQILDMTHVLVTKEFEAVLQEILQGREIKVIHGGILSNYVIHGSKRTKKGDNGEVDIFVTEQETLSKIKTFIEDRGASAVEMFKGWDSNEKMVSVDEFVTTLKNANMDLPDKDIEELAKMLEVAERQIICQDFMDNFK